MRGGYMPGTEPVVNNTAFNKRSFTLATFAAGVRDLFTHLDDLRAAIRQHRVSRAFSERIMLTVTQVNGCRYCSYAHARMALKAGIKEVELRQLISGDFEYAPAYELVALTFAQHYAEQRDRFEPFAWQQLIEAYGDQTARDILAYIRMITFANLIGNTFDAVMSRLSGRPAPNSHFLEEISVLVFTIALMPIGLLAVIVRRIAALLQPDRAANAS
jgi:AhpD family alkylhydroperoxidase